MLIRVSRLWPYADTARSGSALSRVCRSATGAGASLLAAALLAGCARAETSGSRDSAADQDPGVGHIHGLGIDPANGDVYVGAHMGLFRVTEGKDPVRVAGLIRDYMGFTVTGPGTFLASGHPGLQEKADSPHLGLIGSNDAGRTWKEVSAGGEADFHALAPAGQRLYAFDSQSGQLHVSKNKGETWQRTAELPIVDLAADESAPDEVWATTPQGLRRSTDGGRTFAEATGAPTLAYLERPTRNALVGVEPSGVVRQSSDGGRTWKQAGQVPGGAPTALSTTDGRSLLVATGTGVHRSDDGGASFTTVLKTDPSGL